MGIVLTLNFRGYEECTNKNHEIYYLYNFENEKGLSIPFTSSEKYAFEKGKDYKLVFSVSKLYFKGVAK